MIYFGSLFAGIGGFDLGFERCGMQCKWQVEIDDYATRILERHWPDVHRQRDIKQCGRHNLERVDVICGGFPCQDISYAGKGAGLDGERSGLFFEAIRLVRELRPRAVVLENVAGLLTRGLDRVLGTLAEVGYDAEWHCIPASAVGAPHIRDRIFIIGTQHSDSDSFGLCANAKQRQKQQGADASRDSRAKHSADVADAKVVSSRAGFCQDERKGQSQAGGGAEPGNDGGHVPDANGNRGEAGISKQKQRKKGNSEKFNNCRSGWTFQSDWWATEPNVGRVANGVPSRVDRLKCLGNAIVPQVAEVVGRILLERIGGEE